LLPDVVYKLCEKPFFVVDSRHVTPRVVGIVILTMFLYLRNLELGKDISKKAGMVLMLW